MLPGGTPWNWCVCWNSRANASRFAPDGPQRMWRLRFSFARWSGAAPRSIVGHRTFDTEQARVEIGDNQKERFVGVGISHVTHSP
jgi:hypothetical protein